MSREDSVWVAGNMATNGATAIFEATPELDEALFVDGFAWVVVATSDEIMVSASDLMADSRDPGWLPDWMVGPRLPNDLGDICQWPTVDTAPADHDERPIHRAKPRRPR